MRGNVIEADLARLICRFERLSAGRQDCAAIMRGVAVRCLSARYVSYSTLFLSLEKHLAEYLPQSAGEGSNAARAS